MTETPSVPDLLEQVQGYGAWAVIRRKASPTAGLIGGTPHEVASLLDIPLETGAPDPGRSADRRAPEEKTVLCTCHEDHPAQPAGETGCGAYWNIRLSRRRT